MKNCGNETIASRPYETLHKNFFLCSAHFLDKHFTNSKKNGLAKTAVPTIFHGSDEEKFPDVRKASEESHNGHEDIVEESSPNTTENCDHGAKEHFRINNAAQGNSSSSNQEVFEKNKNNISVLCYAPI